MVFGETPGIFGETQKEFLGRRRELLGRHKRSFWADVGSCWADTGVCPYENDGGIRLKGQERIFKLSGRTGEGDCDFNWPFSVFSPGDNGPLLYFLVNVLNR